MQSASAIGVRPNWNEQVGDQPIYPFPSLLQPLTKWGGGLSPEVLIEVYAKRQQASDIRLFRSCGGRKRVEIVKPAEAHRLT